MTMFVSAADGTRDLIGYPVTVMQKILMDTQEIDVSDCKKRAKNSLIQYMGDVIRAFQAFKAEEPNAMI